MVEEGEMKKVGMNNIRTDGPVGVFQLLSVNP